jgi:uncharacterized protein with ParB-like and HNH nuclease domain
MANNNDIIELSIKSLFSFDKYIIPIYQRNYAWGEPEVTQLIQDIVDYSKKNNSPNYYIGTLIVDEKKIDNSYVFYTIDGQQRLTSLTILLSAIKNTYKDIVDISQWYKLNLEFESRKISTETIQYLFDGNESDYKEYNTAIKQSYYDSIKALKRTLKDSHHSNENYCENLAVKKFCDYLLEKVFILRVPVPEDTDLNHYFEIMNSRGEQLEKHEVLKAKCLEILNLENENLSYAFNLIWESCSNMERYVQYGFKLSQRNEVFGQNDWNCLKCKNIDEVSNVLVALKKNDNSDSNSTEQSLKDLINSALVKEPKAEDEETPDRFNTVINFSNLLLHVLRIQTKIDIALDDKRLIELFEPYIKDTDKTKTIEFVKTFGFNLLKCKFLFDKYIIKREFLKSTDRWSLKRLECYNGNKVSYVNSFGHENGNEGENKEILMLQAMFHVSTPTLVYKHWLNAALKYVFENDNINSVDYKNYLENVAKSFLYDRFIAKTPKDYFEIIYTNNRVSVNYEIDESKLDQGTAVENFVFNYLDYLLWKKHESEYTNFEYTFRSSVEHYYPQKPIEGNPELERKYLDNFGNLCLISSSKNSRLSNYMPQAKKEHYQNSTSIDSIKQRLMMKYDNWNIREIEEHGNIMKKILLFDRNISH